MIYLCLAMDNIPHQDFPTRGEVCFCERIGRILSLLWRKLITLCLLVLINNAVNI